MEQWKYVEEYNNKYAVSNYGRVKSFQGRTERILKINQTHDGYEIVVMCINNKPKSYRVNRLVAKYFLENPNNYPQVDHIDENRLNNHVENLQWMSARDNTTKSQGKPVNQLSLKGEFIATHISISHAAKHINADKGNIHKVLINKAKSAYKYKWEYVTTNQCSN
jgi:hypothetical protein